MDIGPLTVFTAVMAVLFIRAGARAIFERKQKDGHGFRIGVAIFYGLVASVAWYFEAAHIHRQNLAGDALEVLTDGKPAAANCGRFSEELLDIGSTLGFVYYNNTSVAHLDRGVCQDVWDYSHGGHESPTEDQMQAVHVVAHETGHLIGIKNEAETECRAVQLNHLVAEYLGATPEEARAMQRWYYDYYYPTMPTSYKSNECREGGEMDMFPDRTVFP